MVCQLLTENFLKTLEINGKILASPWFSSRPFTPFLKTAALLAVLTQDGNVNDSVTSRKDIRKTSSKYLHFLSGF